jgi:hypothetical protein
MSCNHEQLSGDGNSLPRQECRMSCNHEQLSGDGNSL